jgi:poly-gamma-glutamate synthesis protein (capsule biosynthesis protein)
VNTLRYTAEITADAATYATLAEIAKVAPADANSSSGFLLSGRRVKKGSRISVELVADQRDRDEILDAIATARSQADVVVVTFHSHEPGNLSQVPAAFVRDFAHQAIDRGASVVVGTGPRQLRGIEIYQRRAIFYSLGNFAFDASFIPGGAADVYDANTNLNELALDALGSTAPATLPSYDEAVWWESVVATTTFEGNNVTGIRLDPIDLGADLALKDRGRPRLASKDRGLAILRRLADLSKGYGTTLLIENGAGLIDLH